MVDSLPRGLRKRVLDELCTSTTGAHLGREKTWHRDIHVAMECLPAWNVILGQILGFSIGIGIVVLTILTKVKRMRMWA